MIARREGMSKASVRSTFSTTLIGPAYRTVGANAAMDLAYVIPLVVLGAGA